MLPWYQCPLQIIQEDLNQQSVLSVIYATTQLVTPLTDTPLGRHIPRQTPLPWEDTLPKQTPPGQTPHPADTSPPGRHPPQTPPSSRQPPQQTPRTPLPPSLPPPILAVLSKTIESGIDRKEIRNIVYNMPLFSVRTFYY